MVQRLQQMHHCVSRHGVARGLRLSAAIRVIGCATALCVVAIYLLSSANAQTEYRIEGTNPNLESEYRKELDKWMLRAYEGDKEAQFKVGVLFTNDQFNQPDFEQAVYWYKQAALQDHVLAQYNLGHQYLTGVGVAANTETAMQWWLKAAKNNHPLAQFNVGRAYYLGIGLPEDHEKSREWFEMAANNQEPKSIDILKKLGWADSEDFAQAPGENDQQTEQNSQDQVLEEQTIDSAVSADQENADTQTEEQLVSRIIIPADTPLSTPAAPSLTETAEIAETQKVNPETDTLASTVAEPISQAVEPSEADIAVAQTGEAEIETEPKNTPATSSLQPIALYTNPNIRSVLISIHDNKNDLEVLKVGNKWIRVSLKQGFPVWVHEDYIITSDGIGTITGSAVNARSVPIVTNGTIVGKLNENESVEVIDKNNDWYRITSPSRFLAWVKKTDFNRISHTSVNDITDPNDGSIERKAITNSKWRSISAPVKTEPESANSPTKKSTQSEPDNTYLSSINLNNNDWLYSHASDRYTLQLASFSEPEKIAEFISRKKFINDSNLRGFTSQGNNDLVWTYFLYGQYNDLEDAKQARNKIGQKRAWIRNFGKLQQNRCVGWKRQLPPPKALNKYCIN